MNKLFGVLALVAAVLCGALVIGVQRFVPRQIDVAPATPIQIDVDAAAQRLSRAIRHRTVSPVDSASQAEFERFHAFLTESFPALHKRLVRETVNQHSLLYTWQGTRTELKPILLLAHMDVVPADAEDSHRWRHPPFAGAVAEGYLWGRGAMDDKSSLMASLEAIEWLIKQGYQPERTIYLAFGHDEETGGHNGAAKIAAQLQARQLQFEYILDEGGNILSGLLKNVSAPVALIGIAEKGYLSLALTAETAGGHSAIPPTHSAIGKLSLALAALASNPFPSRLSEPTRQMLEYLGPHMAWPERFLLANLWLFEPVIRHQLERSPLTNAAIRTTLAPTLITGGIQENVLPSKARAVVNLRLLPGDITAAVIERVRKIIADNAITMTPLATRVEPSPVTPTSSASFQILQRTVREIIPEAIVAPGLLVATTDSRHYATLSKNVFRFFPITLRPGDTERYHGIDERISVEDYARSVRFYVQLIRNSQSSGK